MYSEPHDALYPADMVKRALLGIQDFRTALATRIKAARDHGEHTVVGVRGKPVVVVVPINWYREAAKAMNDPTEF